MIGHLVELLYTLDMSPYDSLFLLEDPNITIYFCITELVVIEVTQGRGHLILSLMVEKNMKGACVIVNLELGSHWLVHSSQESANQDNVINGISVKLANVIGSWLRIHNHPNGDGRKNFRSPGIHASSGTFRCTAHGLVLRIRILWPLLVNVEKALCIAVGKHTHSLYSDASDKKIFLFIFCLLLFL